MTPTFMFTFDDTGSYQNLGVLNILVNGSLDGRGACYLAYSQPSNVLYLVGDDGGTLSTGSVLTSSGSVGNSQCTVTWGNAPVVAGGTSLTLTLTIAFSGGFSGNKVIYMAARDLSENNSGWQALGVWQVPGAVPITTTSVVGMSPARPNGSISPVAYTFTFSDTKGVPDLGVQNILVNDSLDGRHACYLAYASPANLLYLVNDAGDGLLAGKSLSANGVLTNSQCTVKWGSSPISSMGSSITLALSIAFSVSFSGNRVFYLAARDLTDANNSGWESMGTLSVAQSLPPLNLQAVAISQTQVTLTWTAANTNAIKQHIERRSGAAAVYVEISTTPGASTTYLDTVQPNAPYSYRMRSETTSGLSSYSNETSVTTAAPPVMQGSATSSSEAQLSWSTSATGITRFRIERRIMVSAYAEINQPSATSTWFGDSGLSPSTIFAYRMRLETDAGLSPYSNEVTLTTLAPPPNPFPAGGPLDTGISTLISQVDAGRISSTIQKLAAFETRNSCSDNAAGSRSIGGARDWIQSQFAGIPGLMVTTSAFPMGCSQNQSLQNVIAWIPGQGHPHRLIVLSGHYDSRTVSAYDGTSPSPGANDSGSQTALLIEAARLLAGHSFDATIVFAAFSGEEQGLIGSRSFVGNFSSIFPGAQLELNLNSDIVGGDNTTNNAVAQQQFRLFSPGTPREISSGDGTTDDTSPSRGVMRYVGTWGRSYVPEMTMVPILREDRVGRGGDHESFIASGIAGVRFIEVNENLAHQHTPQDLFTFVTPGYTSRIVKLVTAVAASLARATTPPQSPVVALTSSDTVAVSWQPPSAGPAVDHYVVAARLTSENFYRTDLSVAGNSRSVTVRIQEDLGINAGSAFFVSVAAVDAAGHQSLFAYPEFRCTAAGCAVPVEALNVTASR